MDKKKSLFATTNIQRAEREYKEALCNYGLISSFKPPTTFPECGTCILDQAKKTNIILLPGFDSAGHEWSIFKEALRPWGHQVIEAQVNVKLGNEALTDDLYQWLKENALLYSTPLTLIGFSNGGLICRALLHKYGVMNVRKIIMIATPNWGTSLAVYGKLFIDHPGLKDLTVGSSFLNWLNQDYSAVKYVQHYVITGDAAHDLQDEHFDGVVWESSATLGYSLPYVRVQTGEPVRLYRLNSAWHLNLTAKSTYSVAPANDKAWPITLNYVRCFLTQ